VIFCTQDSLLQAWTIKEQIISIFVKDCPHLYHCTTNKYLVLAEYDTLSHQKLQKIVSDIIYNEIKDLNILKEIDKCNGNCYHEYTYVGNDRGGSVLEL
jgi:hypothetical protein